MIRVLITDICSHIALKLLYKDYEETALDNLLEQINCGVLYKISPLFCSIKNQVHFVKGDVCN